MRLFILTFIFLTSILQAGTPNAASRYVRSYDQAMSTWVEQVQAARGSDAQLALWNRRPEPAQYGAKIWVEIRNNLAEGWTLDYAAWLLENSKETLLPKSGQRRAAGAIRIRKAVEKHHIKSARVGAYCLALTQLTDPGAMGLLERIEKENPDTRVQGAAALAQAILLRKLDHGGEDGIIPKRQAKLRKAIIDGNDLMVGKRTLLSIAQAEVFRLRHLSIGSTAPNLKGIDISMKPVSLEDYRGKVVAVFFWHTWMKDANQSLELIRKLNKELEGKNAVVLGVNADHAQTLRKMTADGDVTWRNFFDNNRKLAKSYHIERWPEVLVLDEEGIIRYRGVPGSFVELAIDALLDK